MIRDLLRPRLGLVALVAFCLLAAQSLDIVPPLIVQKAVDEHLTTGAADGLLRLGILYFGSIVAMRSVNALGIYLAAAAAQGALHELRVRLFAHLQRLPMSYFDRTPLGDIISRGTADVETVDTLFTSGVGILVSSLFSLFATAAAMLALSLPLSLLSALLVPLLIAVTQFFRLRVRDAERANRLATGMLNTHLQETLSGSEVIRAFRREPAFVVRFRRVLHAVVGASNRATVYNSFYPPVMAVLSAATVVLLLSVGSAGFGAQWGVSIGVLTAFVLLYRRFFNVIVDLGDEWQTVQAALSGLERIGQVLAEPVESMPAPAGVATGAAPHGLELRHVNFGYQAGNPVLRDLSLHVQAGEHVALVGRTGAGKTSALHLLAGLYAPWDGAVHVDGRDPRTLDAGERRSLVGVVPQMVQLFGGSVHDNLSLGDPAVSREAVERAARLAGADAFVRAMSEGYDTVLSGSGRGGGAQLSAGQRQLLALARALVWEPRALLLDEATAAVDNASDAAFRAALRAEATSQGCAVLTVAHRLATAREADRIVVVEAGRVVEEGTPNELIERGGKFAALVELEEAGWDWQET